MRLVLPLFAFLSATPALADFNTLVQDGIAVINDLGNVQTKLAAFAPNSQQGTTDQALAVNDATTSLNSDLSKAASDAAASEPLTADQSAFFANAVAGLQTNIFNILDSLVAKKPSFQKVNGFIDTTSLVYSQLVGLRKNLDGFGTNLSSKLTTEYAKLGPLLVSNIDYHIVRATQAYQNSTS